MSLQLSDGLANQPLDLVLEDLLVRFLANVPDEDLSSIERVLFQVEEAQWFYTDFLRQKSPYLPQLKMKGFAAQLLEKCPLIWKWGNPSDALGKFGRYKSTIPVRGVALFNKDLTKMVLVKGTESNSWSFPRGKISKDEADTVCAARECYEETSYDVKDAISEDNCIERTIRGKNYKIYLVKNVPEDFDFQPIVRGEIAKIQWHDIKTTGKKVKSSPNQYFIVSAIWKPLTRWVNKNRGVSNEEELLVKAEFRLKEYLGILPKAQENVDAGRELLNILQGSSKETSNNLQAASQNQVSLYQQFIHSSLPQHLHNLLPFFPYAPAPPMPMYYPSFIPPQSLSQPPAPQPQSVPSVDAQPNPSTLQKPAMSSVAPNSKEFLSILSQPKKSTAPTPEELPKKSTLESNRSKAQQLMSLFKKAEPAKEPTSEPVKEPTSTEPKESAPASIEAAKPEPSPRVSQFDIENSLPNLGVLGVQQASNELEESLRSSHPGSGNNSRPSTPAGKLKILKRPTASGDKQNASSELLSLLKPKQTPKSTEENPQLPKVQEKINGNSKASSDLLSLLKKPRSPEQPTVNTPEVVYDSTKSKQEESNSEEFQDFEDFEDFDALDQSFGAPPTNFHQHFDIDSDDEHEEEEQVEPVPVMPPKIQVLKRNQENLDEGAGKSLLHLLNGKTKDESPKTDFSSIYGTDSAQGSEEPQFVPPVTSPSQAASSSFLSILTRPTESNPQVSSPPAQKNANSPAKNILDILHGRAK